MPTRAEIEQEFKKYFPGRAVSEQDVQNATDKGLGVIKSSYDSITGQGTSTPQQQGQQESTTSAPTLTPVEQEYKTASDSLAQQSGQKSSMLSILQKALQAKGQQQAPYTEAIGKVKKQLYSYDPTKYKGMSPEQVASLTGKDLANIRVNLDSLREQQAQAQLEESKIIDATRSAFEDQLQAQGLTLEEIGYRRANEREDRQNAINLAFQPMTLLSGVMPPGVPENMIPQWEAASNKAKEIEAYDRAQAAKKGSGSGSRASSDSSFRTAAANAIRSLDSGKTEWATEWDTLKVKFPEKSNEEIDAALGGSYGTDGPTGRAKTSYGASGTSVSDESIWAQLSSLSPEDAADTNYVREQIMALGRDPEDFGY